MNICGEKQKGRSTERMRTEQASAFARFGRRSVGKEFQEEERRTFGFGYKSRDVIPHDA